MRVSELRPCDGCKGPLQPPPMGCFYVVKVVQHMLNPKTINRHLGLMQVLGGGSAGHVLADVMGPGEAATIQFGTDVELYLCFDCATGGKECNLIGVAEERTAALAKATTGEGE